MNGPQVNDVFISYARVDNEFLWVNRLMATLQGLFRGINHDVAPSFHLDERSIRGNDPLDETLKSNVQRSVAMLIIMSENWCGSQYCPRELDWFIEAAGGLTMARRRIFIVQLSQFEVKRWPSHLHQNISKRGFEENETTGHIEPISLDFKTAGKPPSVCIELANELWDCLEDRKRVPTRKSRTVNAPNVKQISAGVQTETSVSGGFLSTQSTKPTIFLAEVHRSLRDARRKLNEDLQREGYRVVPQDREFRNDRDAAEQELVPLLRDARLVVQLHHEKAIGTEEFDPSFDQWLKEHSLTGRLPLDESRLRWRKRGLEQKNVSDQEHRALIFEADVIASDEAQLTELVLERMNKIEQRDKVNLSSSGSRKILIRAKDISRELADELCDQIETFSIPEVNASLQADIVREDVTLTVMDEELKRLSNSPVGLFVVYTDDDEAWAERRMRECRTIALRRKPHLPVTAVYVRPIDDQPRPKALPGRFEVLRFDETDKLHLVLRQALEVKS